MVLIKFTLFLATHKSLKLLEVLYLLLLITNGALYAEDQYEYCVSVKFHEALEIKGAPPSSSYFRDFEDHVTR